MRDPRNGANGRPGPPEGLRPAIPNDDPDVLAAFGAPAGAPLPVTSLRCSPSDRARALGARGRCLPTGLAALDEATRGGPRVGSFGVLGGAPGAGKTTLLCQVALHRLVAGDHVALLAADEGPDGLLIRLGQLLGFDREALEQGDPDVREAFAVALEAYGARLELLDVADDWTLEEAAERLVVLAGSTPAFLGVDSIQTARAFGTDAAEGPRARADAVVHALKSAARRGVFVLATSELARGAYRSNDPAQRTNSLASFKESGSVEYGVDFALVLRSVTGEADLVDVEVAKNRLGSKPEFRLRLDRMRALFSEEGRPAEPDRDAARTTRQRAEDAALRSTILAFVRAHRVSDKALIREGVGRGRTAVYEMLRAMMAEGAIDQDSGGVYRVRPTTGPDRES